MTPVGGPMMAEVVHLNTEARLKAENLHINPARLLVTDPSMIGGSAPQEMKQRVFDILGTTCQAGVFAANVSQTISIQQVDMEKVGGKLSPSVIGEVAVTQGLCLPNLDQTLYLIPLRNDERLDDNAWWMSQLPSCTVCLGAVS